MSKAKNPSGDKQPASKRDGMSMLEASNVWLEAQQKIGEAWLASSRRMLEEQGKRVSDPLGAQEAFAQLGQSLMRDPSALSAAQTNLLKQYFDVYARMLGMETEHDESASQNQDRRFKDESWSKNPLFEALKQAYLATGKVMLDMVQTADGLDDSTRARLDFVVRQIIDAASPTNFALTNPEVLRATIESGGANLVSGLKNLIDDLSRSNERLDIAMVDKSAFKVGETLAVTPGKVIYRNRLFELLQYEPVTEQVCKRPLLVIPPWMNKFYILDLRPGNSFIEWLVSQGQTVFVVSWVNPDRSLADASFDTYLLEGAVDAVDVVLEATGEPELNVVGYCLGGILTAAMLAYMAGKQDKRVKSATLLTTMVDFKDAGELKLFINEKSLPELEAQIDNDGYLDGRTLYDATRAIRANDLIWSFYVNNYLLGKSPPAFDLLYWNSDGTNMPAGIHRYVMRNFYLDNKLRESDALTLGGVSIDMKKVKTPTYVVATMEDHIAPWKTCYEVTQLFSGPVRFVLGESGHIAGVVNPPQKNRYGYWTNSKKHKSAQAWLESATRSPGSWWSDWNEWIGKYAGARVEPRDPAQGPLPVLGDAPGSYVLKTLD